MKKSCITALTLLALVLTHAQDNTINFFESNGSINTSRELFEDMSYTLLHLDHRADDVVWASVVYSIIDLRDNRNLQVAFPIETDGQFQNLFRLMANAVVDRTPVYYANETAIAPNFAPSNRVATANLTDVFFIETNVAGAQYIDPLFDYNAESETLGISSRIYDRFAQQITKFMLQKVYYFDKHLSRFHTKIVAIAPLISEPDILQFDDDEDIEESDAATVQQLKITLRESILCWFLYEDLKPHFSNQLVYQESNIAQRVSYHEYFTKKMFSDYLVGDNNLLRQLYSSNATETTIPQLRASIKQVANELIEIESGAWNY
jgi:hypothetical protein